MRIFLDSLTIYVTTFIIFFVLYVSQCLFFKMKVFKKIRRERYEDSGLDTAGGMEELMR